MLSAFDKAAKNYNLVHIGNVDQITVNETADIICRVVKLENVVRRYTGGKLGWKGDVASNFIANETLTAWGWKPPRSSREAVEQAGTRLAESS